MPVVMAQCRACRGTGITDGGFLHSTERMLCITCAGTACEEIVYDPFTGRATTESVLLVHSADFKDTISYAEFAAGAYPGDAKKEDNI